METETIQESSFCNSLIQLVNLLSYHKKLLVFIISFIVLITTSIVSTTWYFYEGYLDNAFKSNIISNKNGINKLNTIFTNHTNDINNNKSSITLNNERSQENTRSLIELTINQRHLIKTIDTTNINVASLINRVNKLTTDLAILNKSLEGFYVPNYELSQSQELSKSLDDFKSKLQ